MGVERVWVHPEAIEEARATYEWYRERSPEIADAFMSELDRGIELISEAPNRLAPHVVGTRRCMLRRFPYFIVFREAGDTVEVLAIAHARRRPGYWRVR